MNIAEILKQQYTSKNGSVRFKTLPISYYNDIIDATADYKSSHPDHMKIRCWMLINNVNVPICLHCNHSFYPTTTEQFHKTYCSIKCANQSDEKKKQIIDTSFMKWGYENVAKVPDVKQKKKKNALKKYGVDSYSQTAEFKTKFKNTMNKRYGVDYAMQSPELRERYSSAFLEKDTLKKRMNLTDENIDIVYYADQFKHFMHDKTIQIAANTLQIDPNTIRRYITIHQVTDYIINVSSLEVEMASWLTSMNIQFIQNNRTQITPHELDFYLPEYNLAIEMNGIYWHSTAKVIDKNYHYNKWKKCHEQGIQLLTIFEDQWNFEQDKIKHIILSRCNLKTKVVGARKCTIQQIESTIARKFVSHYHIQNFVAGTNHYGAYYKNELVAVMTFGWTRGSVASRRFELKRFVTNPTVSYPGLFSKIFKHAYNDIKFTQVVSFSDNCLFNGNMYEKAGFTNQKMMPIGYKYLFQNQLVHCSRFTKAGIKKKFPSLVTAINNGMTESAAMIQLNIPRVYDCGKKEWIWKDWFTC